MPEANYIRVGADKYYADSNGKIQKYTTRMSARIERDKLLAAGENVHFAKTDLYYRIIKNKKEGVI